MTQDSQVRYKALATVVQISTTKKDLSGKYSHRNYAFVEFTDYKGEPATGNFRIVDTPLYTTIRIGTTVEIEYFDTQVFNGYTVILVDPEKYERTPTPEEMAPYRRNKTRVLKQCLMAVGVFWAAVILSGITHSRLPFLLLVAACFPIMGYGSKRAREDSGKMMSWEQEAPE